MGRLTPTPPSFYAIAKKFLFDNFPHLLQLSFKEYRSRRSQKAPVTATASSSATTSTTAPPSTSQTLPTTTPVSTTTEPSATHVPVMPVSPAQKINEAASLLLTPRTVSLSHLSRTPDRSLPSTTTTTTTVGSQDGVVHSSSSVTNGTLNHAAVGKMTAEEAQACGENNALFLGGSSEAAGVCGAIGEILGALQRHGVMGPLRSESSHAFQAVNNTFQAVNNNEYMERESSLEESGLCDEMSIKINIF